MRRKLATHIDRLADGVTKKTVPEIIPATDFVTTAMLADSRYGEYSHNTIARFEELQAFAFKLSHEV
jgi:multidrug resistance protein MdtO